MEYELLGDPDGGPAVRLDHEQFSYAGKFVMTNTGKALARKSGKLLAAIAFNRDRTDDGTVWFRYITVHAEHRGEGIGPKLAVHAARGLLESVDRLKIAVNNPFAYEALYKAGFGYIGEETGLAEFVLQRPIDRSSERYREGYRAFEERDLSGAEQSLVTEKSNGNPPDPVSP